MINRIGPIQGFLRDPYIYFISIANYLYIGETSQLPVRRWGQHISERGTFLERMKDIDYEVLHQGSALTFIGYSCKPIRDVNLMNQKTVLRYLEHKVHEKLVCHPILGPTFIVVSDTTRTAPTYCKYRWINGLAEVIVDSFYADFVETTL